MLYRSWIKWPMTEIHSFCIKYFDFTSKHDTSGSSTVWSLSCKTANMRSGQRAAKLLNAKARLSFSSLAYPRHTYQTLNCHLMWLVTNPSLLFRSTFGHSVRVSKGSLCRCCNHVICEDSAPPCTKDREQQMNHNQIQIPLSPKGSAMNEWSNNNCHKNNPNIVK